MQLVYLGRSSRRTLPDPGIDGDVVELFADNWDDYGYKTSFAVSCRLNGIRVELGPVRILIENVSTTSIHLNRLRAEGWDGTFPIPDTNYVSTPSDITFYEQVDGILQGDAAITVAQQLRDASYLVRIANDPVARQLVESRGFTDSLQRERGSVKAYLDGWLVFERRAIAVLDLGFRFLDIFGQLQTLELRFQPRHSLPHDVNVLIGPNGNGKSQLLHQMVEDWINPRDGDTGFVEKPNLSQLVLVSYSPFEFFPVDLAANDLRDKDAYHYFGLRGRRASADATKPGRIVISRDYPKRAAAHALLQCVADDARYRGIRDWSRKVETVATVLKAAIQFDTVAVEVAPQKRLPSLYTVPEPPEPQALHVVTERARQRFIPISPDRVDALDTVRLKEAILPTSGVTFFQDGIPIRLSSGQQLFAYLVINIVGAIRRNSLILIDEPELFLHPTLEIQFVDMLKTILRRFNSKALLATHSVVTVREVPADCVHVFEKTDDGLLLKHPPFQTFGGDVQRISSYVFGDKAISKPFENWIRSQLEEFGTADSLIEALGDQLNEELIVQIRAMESGHW